MHRRVVPAARRGDITVDELPLPHEQQSEPAFEEFDRNWEQAKKENSKPKLMKVSTPAPALQCYS